MSRTPGLLTGHQRLADVRHRQAHVAPEVDRRVDLGRAQRERPVVVVPADGLERLRCARRPAHERGVAMQDRRVPVAGRLAGPRSSTCRRRASIPGPSRLRPAALRSGRWPGPSPLVTDRLRSEASLRAWRSTRRWFRVEPRAARSVPRSGPAPISAPAAGDGRRAAWSTRRGCRWGGSSVRSGSAHPRPARRCGVRTAWPSCGPRRSTRRCSGRRDPLCAGWRSFMNAAASPPPSLLHQPNSVSRRLRTRRRGRTRTCRSVVVPSPTRSRGSCW